MSAEPCFVCGNQPADPGHPYMVGMQRAFSSGVQQLTERRDVAIPVCNNCHVKTTKAELRKNRVILLWFIVPTILGIITGLPEAWLQGGGLGFAIGFFAALIAKAVIRNPVHKHPDVQFLERRGGWSVD